MAIADCALTVLSDLNAMWLAFVRSALGLCWCLQLLTSILRADHVTNDLWIKCEHSEQWQVFYLARYYFILQIITTGYQHPVPCKEFLTVNFLLFCKLAILTRWWWWTRQTYTVSRKNESVLERSGTSNCTY